MNYRYESRNIFCPMKSWPRNIGIASMSHASKINATCSMSTNSIGKYARRSQRQRLTFFFPRYRLREKTPNLFEHPETVGQLKSLLNRNTATVHHRALPAKNVDNQNIFFCRYVYDNRAKRILKNPCLNNSTVPLTASPHPATTISVPTAARM